MQKIVAIDGMSCEHCAQRIEKVLSNMEEIDEVKVNLENKQAVIKGENINDDIIKEKIEDIGFVVKNIKEG